MSVGSNTKDDSSSKETEPLPISKSGEKRGCYKRFIKSKCFKYTFIVLIVIYGLNIVAWGGMLFLILVGAANRTMPDENTRKIWIEIDSQILNALFCVTGIGLIPCRVRDVYQFHSKAHHAKILKRHKYTDNRVWIGIVVWTFIANSCFQIGMAICMWSMDMNTRPAWLVGLFVGLGCVSGIVAGLIQFILGQQKKKKAQSEQNESLTERV